MLADAFDGDVTVLGVVIMSEGATTYPTVDALGAASIGPVIDELERLGRIEGRRGWMVHRRGRGLRPRSAARRTRGRGVCRCADRHDVPGRVPPSVVEPVVEVQVVVATRRDQHGRRRVDDVAQASSRAVAGARGSSASGDRRRTAPEGRAVHRVGYAVCRARPRARAHDGSGRVVRRQHDEAGAYRASLAHGRPGSPGGADRGTPSRVRLDHGCRPRTPGHRRPRARRPASRSARYPSRSLVHFRTGRAHLSDPRASRR